MLNCSPLIHRRKVLCNFFCFGWVQKRKKNIYWNETVLSLNDKLFRITVWNKEKFQIQNLYLSGRNSNRMFCLFFVEFTKGKLIWLHTCIFPHFTFIASAIVRLRQQWCIWNTLKCYQRWHISDCMEILDKNKTSKRYSEVFTNIQFFTKLKKNTKF